MREKRKELKFDPDRLDELLDEVTYDLIQSIIIEKERKRSKEVWTEVKINAAIPKWIGTGVLNGLEEGDKFIMTVMLEELLRHVINAHTSFEIQRETSFIYTLAFGITRRLYDRGKLKRFSKSKDIIETKRKAETFAKDLIEDVVKFYQSPVVSKYVNDLRTLYGNTITMEAEVSTLYVDSFTWKNFKKDKLIKISFESLRENT